MWYYGKAYKSINKGVPLHPTFLFNKTTPQTGVIHECVNNITQNHIVQIEYLCYISLDQVFPRAKNSTQHAGLGLSTRNTKMSSHDQSKTCSLVLFVGATFIVICLLKVDSTTTCVLLYV